MGWASASRIMNQIIEGVMPAVQDHQTRMDIYEPIIGALEDGDWDTQDESMGLDPAFDEVMKALHPDWFENEE